jgi:galactose oxidase
LEEEEIRAYRLLERAASTLPAGQEVTVSGPLIQTSAGYELHVRRFEDRPARE